MRTFYFADAVSSIITQSFICSNNNKNMHINTSESSRTARSHKNTDSWPPFLSGSRFDDYHTSTHDVVLVRI